MVALDEGQYELDGLLLGSGTQYRVESLSWRGVPDVRLVRRDKPQQHGVEIGPDLMGSRHLQAMIVAEGDTPADGWDLYEALAEKLTSGVVRSLRLRPRGAPSARRVTVLAVGDTGRETPMVGRRVYRVPVQWEAPDPRIYSDDATDLSTGLGSKVGGLGFPHGFAHGFGLATPGLITAVNVGNASVWPAVRVDAGVGGGTNLEIEHVGRGEAVVFSDTLAAGDHLIYDFEHQLVLLNGTASRFGSLSSYGFFPIDPGSNEIRFRGSGAATLSLSFSSGWSV